jgi:chromosome segregation ATPase
MTKRPAEACAVRPIMNLCAAVAAPLLLIAVWTGPALAQAESKSAEAVAQTDEFNRQRGDLLNRLKDLKSKIDNAGIAMNQKADAPEVARQAIEDMRAVVSPLLAAVADNSDIAKLGAKALKNATDRKAALERNPHFTPEERQKLVDAWAKRIKTTADEMAELDKARAKFLKLMTALQDKEELIGEWAAIRAQDEVIATIRQLTQTLNETSADVSNFIAGLESPGT